MMREGMEMSAEFGGKIMEQAIGSAFVYVKEKKSMSQLLLLGLGLQVSGQTFMRATAECKERRSALGSINASFVCMR